MVGGNKQYSLFVQKAHLQPVIPCCVTTETLLWICQTKIDGTLCPTPLDHICNTRGLQFTEIFSSCVSRC